MQAPSEARLENLFLVPEVTFKLDKIAGREEKHTVQQVSEATRRVFSELETFTAAQSYAAALNVTAFYAERVITKEAFRYDSGRAHEFAATTREMRQRRRSCDG